MNPHAEAAPQLHHTDDVLRPGPFVTPEANAIVSESSAYMCLRSTAMAENQWTFHGLTTEHVALDANGQPVAAIININAMHEVTREGSDGTVPEPIPGMVEVRLKDDIRRALVIRCADGTAYTVARPSEAVCDKGPVTLDNQTYVQAISVARRELRPGRLTDTSRYSQPVDLFVSPGGTTSRVHMETTELDAPALTDKQVARLERKLARQGLTLASVEAVALATNDMATFAQMVELLPSDAVERSLEARAEREQNERLDTPDEVPRGFFAYTQAAAGTADVPGLSSAQMQTLRQAPAMRRLYAKLAAAGYDQADVEWAYLPQIAGEDRFLFASVTNFRRRGTSQRVPAPLFVRDDAVSGLVRLGTDVFTVKQARAATGSNHFEEALAGMLDPADPLHNVMVALRTRLHAEIHEETGIPEAVIDASAFVPAVSGLYPSTHGTERIHLGVLDGPALPPEVRDRLVGTVHGLRDEHEAVQLVLTQHVEQIRADAQDLKTYLLTLVFEHYVRRATVQALASALHEEPHNMNRHPHEVNGTTIYDPRVDMLAHTPNSHETQANVGNGPAGSTVIKQQNIANTSYGARGANWWAENKTTAEVAEFLAGLGITSALIMSERATTLVHPQRLAQPQ